MNSPLGYSPLGYSPNRGGPRFCLIFIVAVRQPVAGHGWPSEDHRLWLRLKGLGLGLGFGLGFGF